MYKVTATIIKNGQSPVIWSRNSEQKMKLKDVLIMFGHSAKNKVVIEDFKCERV